MMYRLDNILKKVIETSNGQAQFKLHWLKAHWVEVVGVLMGEHSWPIKLERRSLLVGMDSSVWNQALFIQKRNLLPKIASFCAPLQIDEIKSIVAEKPTPWPLRSTVESAIIREAVLTDEERLQFEDEAKRRCKEIDDENLRKILEKITMDLLINKDT